MDLAKFDFSGASKLHLRDPITGSQLGTDEKPVWIEYAGTDSEDHSNAVREFLDKRLKDGADGDLDVIERDDFIIYSTAKCVKAWEGIEWNGSALPCTFENAKMIHKALRWLREDAMVHRGKRENFLHA
jgi:hypothetical protein